MKAVSIALLVIALVAGIQAPARADKWYQNEGVWGAAGLVTGGVIGYALGRSSSPRYHSYPPNPYYADPYAGPIHGTGAYYYREKRAFPFYHKVEYYPIASTMPAVWSPQSYSVRTFVNEDTGRATDVREQQQPLSISIGDNNQNVSITVGGEQQTPAQEPTEVVSIQNNPDTIPANRVVDKSVTRRQAEALRGAANPSPAAPPQDSAEAVTAETTE